MPEYRYYERGRRLLPFTKAANRAAVLLGEDLPFPRLENWLWRWILLIWFLISGKRPSRPDPLPPNPDCVRWGGIRVPCGDAIGHFVVYGGTGSGKSRILDTLMMSALRHFGPGKDQRAFVFDAKREQYAKLVAARFGVPILLADPFDERGWAWDIAQDLTCQADARQFAECLIPASKSETDRFWTMTGQNMVAGVIDSFNATAPGQWTFRDVLLTMRSRERLEQVLGSNPETAHIWEESARDERTVSNLMASFNAQLSRYNTVAALWARCPRRFSLKDWVKSDSILIIRSHPKYSAVLRPLHQAMIDTLADYLLSREDSQVRRTWLFLDECRDLGKVPKLARLANLSRSVGGVLALGIQSVEGLYEAYGSEHAAAELLGQIRHVTFLRTNSATTASFAERYFGSVEWLVERISVTRGTSANGETTRSTTADHSRRTEPLILGSEIMSIPPPSLTEPLILFNDIPSIGCFKSVVPLQHLIVNPPPESDRVPNVIEVGSQNQSLKEWEPEDLRRLALPTRLLRLPAAQNGLALAQLEALTQLEQTEDPNHS